MQSAGASAADAGWALPVDKTFNLYRMQPDLYRSALTNSERQSELQRLKIATVINFYQHSDSEWLSDPGFRQIHQPLHADRVDAADVLQALRSIRQAQANGPALVHCKHGQNRTGMIAAMYCIVCQGWSKQQAIDEMRGAALAAGSGSTMPSVICRRSICRAFARH